MNLTGRAVERKLDKKENFKQTKKQTKNKYGYVFCNKIRYILREKEDYNYIYAVQQFDKWTFSKAALNAFHFSKETF